MLIIGLLFAFTAFTAILRSDGYVKTSDNKSADQSSASSDTFTFNTEATDIIPGDIFDRNGVKLCDFSNYLIDKKGTYIDNDIYSPLLGVMMDQKAITGGLIGKYYNVLRDNSGDNIRGKDLFLTIDHRLQKDVFNLLKEDSEGKKCSAIVLDAESGEMLACVDLPTFSANDPTTQKDFLFYSHSDMTFPGSTFKLMTSVMILEENDGENLLYSDKAYLNVGGIDIGNWYTGSNDYDDNCELNYLGGLGRSSNIFFANAITQIKDSKAKMTDIVHRIGLGSPICTDFGDLKSLWELDDMPSEYTPNDRQYHWATTGFGQGHIKMSATNNAMIAAAIINEGHITEPHMVASIKNCYGEEEDLDKAGAFYNIDGLASTHREYTLTNPDVAEKLYKAMINTNNNMNYIIKNTDKPWIGAKTGTAEIGNGGEEKALWTVSNAEIQGHKYAVAIVKYPFYGQANSRILIPVINNIYDSIETTIAANRKDVSNESSIDLSEVQAKEIINYFE